MSPVSLLCGPQVTSPGALGFKGAGQHFWPGSHMSCALGFLVWFF